MTIGTLNIKLRPLRIGFLVNPTDRDGIHKAIHANSLLWGGMFNPIIPCYKRLPANWEKHKSKLTTASKVITGYIEGFDPDYLVTVNDVTTEGVQFDNERIINCDDLLSNYKKDMSPSVGAGVFEVIRQFKYDEMRFIRRKEFKIIKPKLHSKHKLFLSSLFGDIGEYEDEFYNNYLNDIEVNQENIDTGNYWKFLDRNIFYPRRIGAIYIKQRLRGPVIFYLDPNDNLDVIDFWNLRAAGWEIFPAVKQSSDDKSLQSRCENIIENAYRPYRGNPKIYHYVSIIKSRSLKEKEAEKFRDKLKIKKHDNKKGPKLLLQWWYPRIRDEWARQNTEENIMPAYSRDRDIELQEGQTGFRFKTLDPEFEESGQPTN